MRKKIGKKIAAIAMGAMVLTTGIVGINGNHAKSASYLSVEKNVQVKTRKPKVSVNAYVMQLKTKKTYVFLKKAPKNLQTVNWKSSNTKIATVDKKGDSDIRLHSRKKEMW